jgi:putative ABC transport system ATP-binding protein
MNILGCLDRPTKGSYILDGQDVSEMTKMSAPIFVPTRLVLSSGSICFRARQRLRTSVMLYAGVSGSQRHARAMASGRSRTRRREQNHPISYRAVSNNARRGASSGKQSGSDSGGRPFGNLDSHRSRSDISALESRTGITLILVTHEAGHRAVRTTRGRFQGWQDGDYQVEDQRNAAKN